MREQRLKNSAGVLNIPMGDAQALLEAGNGDAALLYLYILRSGGSLDSDRAATELHRSDRDIEAAADRLGRMGLLETGETRRTRPAPVQELPEYPVEDIVRRSKESPEFTALCAAVEDTLGRVLSTPDLKRLFGIYDSLALPADVILLLVQRCKEDYRERYGESKNVGFAFIEKEAYAWHNREIMTYEQANQWLEEMDRRKSVFSSLRRTIGLHDRDFTDTERRYITSWLELGFGEEAIAIAIDRTITNTNGLKWKYADSIVRSWHRMGLHTPEEIEAGDKPSKASRRAAVTAPTRDDSKTLDQLNRLREKMKQEA